MDLSPSQRSDERRQLDPLSWGKAFKKLLKLLGVKGGKGGDRRSNEPGSLDTAKSVAAELGVEHRTAQKRLKLADDYDNLPVEEQALVDAGRQKKTTSDVVIDAMALKQEIKSNTQAVIARKLGVGRQTVSDWFTKNTTNAGGGNSCKPQPDSRVKIPPTANPVILDRIEAGESQEQVASDYGVTQQAISRIATKEKKEREAKRRRATARTMTPRSFNLHWPLARPQRNYDDAQSVVRPTRSPRATGPQGPKASMSLSQPKSPGHSAALGFITVRAARSPRLRKKATRRRN